ncbi:MAG: ABC transporter substrate-binding protein [Anaerorhabdus sp.]
MKKLKVLLVFICVLSLVGCSSSKSDATKSPAVEMGKVLYSNGGPEEFFETPWLNPGTFFYNKVLYSHLLVADENLSALSEHPDGLAKSYTYSEDGKTLEFVLRDDIYWHDGEKITAEDIKWSIEYATKTTTINAVFKSTFDAIAGSSNDTFSGIVVDGNKITITFESVAPDALLTFTQFAPLPKKYFEGVDPLNFQQAEFFQKPVGSGPFMVDEVKLKDFTTLKAFDKYYNGVADFSIQLSPSPGDSDPSLVKNAMSNQVDIAYTKSVADVKSLEGTDGITVTPVNVRYTRLLYMNKFNKADGSASPIADQRVRQAIAYAIDMDAIAENLYGGNIIASNSLIPGESDKASGLNYYKYDTEKAKALLEEANWDPNYEIDVVYYYTDQVTVDLMTSIQFYLSEVGVKMNFRLLEGDLATLLWQAPEDVANGPSAVDWDMAYGGVGALSLHEYYDRYRSGSSMNSHTPTDETLDALIDATNASTDVNAQIEAFKELSKYENENLFALALYYQPIFVITSDRVAENFDLSKLGNPQFNYNWDIQNWKIK